MTSLIKDEIRAQLREIGEAEITATQRHPIETLSSDAQAYLRIKAEGKKPLIAIQVVGRTDSADDDKMSIRFIVKSEDDAEDDVEIATAMEDVDGIKTPQEVSDYLEGLAREEMRWT